MNPGQEFGLKSDAETPQRDERRNARVHRVLEGMIANFKQIFEIATLAPVRKYDSRDVLSLVPKAG